MVSLIAPPEIFSAYAFALADDDSDPDLRKGTHLRIYAGLGASFPLLPFVVARFKSSESERPELHVTDREGHRVPAPDLDAYGLIDTTLLLKDTETTRTVRIDLDENSAAIEGARLLDQKGRTIAIRNQPPWWFSAPLLHKLRIWGNSGQVEFGRRIVRESDLFELAHMEPLAMGFPIVGDHFWYVGRLDREEAVRRVQRGAPKRLNPMDRPFGPFSRVDPIDEQNRVEAMLGSMQFGSGLERLLRRMVEDGERPPWRQREQTALPVESGPQQFANAHRLGIVQMAAVDPGLGRFLGFSDKIEDLPDFAGGGDWDTLCIFGLFAFSPRDFLRYGVDLMPLLHMPAAGSDMLLDRLIEDLQSISGENLRDPIEAMSAQIRDQGFAVAPFMTFAAPVPPWLPPQLPKQQIIQTRWQNTKGDGPSELFRSTFAFPRMPLASLSALGRIENGHWVSRHDKSPVASSVPPKRANPGIFGHELEPNSRLNELKPKVKVQQLAGVVSDHDIPGDQGPVSFAVRASDFFGRFGKEVVFDVQPPARPKPPLPILRCHFERGMVDLSSENELSPGLLRMTVAVPESWPEERFTPEEVNLLGSSIVVPRLDDLAPGAYELATLEFGLETPDSSIYLTEPGFFPIDIPLPSLGPQETRTFQLTGRFIDTKGNASDIATLPIVVTDIRPPHIYKTGRGLFWTTAPGPSPTVEVKLRWKAGGKSRHRVYLADQAGLALDSELAVLSPNGVPSRGLVAAVGCNRVRDGLADRTEPFRLLTDPPIEADAAGDVIFTTTLPRSLSTVQFLRVVPLGPDGAEPAFAKCGIVPIAVPESRRPPAPRLDGGVDPTTGYAALTVSSDGFDLVALKRDEPGLFDPALEGKEPPRAYLRRAVGPIADPIYARQIDSGLMERTGDETNMFSVEIADTNDGRGLEPFVNYVYWAEVQLPPERRLPADYQPANPTPRVFPVDSAAEQSHPRPRSLPSPPRILMHVPAGLPDPPDPANITIDRGMVFGGKVRLAISIADPPKAHRKAVGQFRLAVWFQWPSSPIQAIEEANGQSLEGAWPEIGAGTITTHVALPMLVNPTAALKLRFAFVDPIGRMSEIVAMNT